MKKGKITKEMTFAELIDMDRNMAGEVS